MSIHLSSYPLLYLMNISHINLKFQHISSFLVINSLCYNMNLDSALHHKFYHTNTSTFFAYFFIMADYRAIPTASY